MPGKQKPKVLSVSELVEALGFGSAQVRTLVFAVGAAYSMSSAAITLSSLSATPVAESFGQNTDDGALGRALPTTMILAGLLFGNALCGYLSDSLGRRPTLLYGLGLIAAAGAAGATVNSSTWMCCSRLFAGLGAGLSMGPALVLMSETTPEDWRIWAQGMRGIAFEFGRIGVALLCAVQDPMLLQLNWRMLSVFIAVVAVVFFACAWLLIAESPVFLACIGQHSAAREGFIAMQKHNGVSVDVAYAPPVGPAERNERTLMLREQLAFVFSSRFRFVTCAAMLASLTGNLLAYADMYAAARVLPSASALAPAWQFSLQRSGAIFWNLLCIPVAGTLPRRAAVVASLVIGALGCLGFAITGAMASPRPLLFEACFQLSTSGIALSTVLSFIAVNQLAVEIYPRTAAGMGFAVIIGSGRLGALGAPLLVEALLPVQLFACHYTMAFLCFLSAAVVWQAPNIEPYRVGIASGNAAEDYGAAML